MNHQEKLLLLLILIFATFLRVYKLDQVPPHLSNDEISIAYDAYSVSKTLRDEYGHFLPLSFKSHNTYKAPLTAYLTVPSIMLLGNNEWGARMPSVVIGLLTIFVLILLTYQLTGNSKFALLSGFLLSITPWHVYSSRMILEANIALFFVVFGVYLFYRGLIKNSKISYLLGFISFAISIWGYHTEWIFTPILMLCFFLLNLKQIIKKRILLFGLIFFGVLVLPIVFDAINNIHTNARTNTESILNEKGVVSALQSPKLNVVQKTSVILGSALGNYSQYTNPGYLFYDGLRVLPPYDPFQIGLFYLIFLPLGIFGLFYVKKYFNGKSNFIYLWVLTAPLVPALTRDAPNSVRNLVSVIPYIIVITAGLYEILIRFKKNILVLAMVIFLIFASFLNFFSVYQYNFPIYSAIGFQYGYKQMALYIKANYSKYDRIIIDPRFGPNSIYDGVPRLYIPYFTGLDPQIFLNTRKDLITGLYFDKYEQRGIDWNVEPFQVGTLYIVPSSNSPDAQIEKKLTMVLEIKYPNYDSAFKLYVLIDKI